MEKKLASGEAKFDDPREVFEEFLGLVGRFPFPVQERDTGARGGHRTRWPPAGVVRQDQKVGCVCVAEYNLAFDERHAKAAKDLLIAVGVAGERVSTFGCGEERLFVPGPDDCAEKWNRRAHGVLQGR